MIFLILPFIVIVSIIAIDFYNWGEIDGDTIMRTLLALLISLLVALFIWLGASCVIPGETTTVDTYEIHALTDNIRYSNLVSNSVFLIQSHSDEKLKYSYMYEVDGKGYKFNEVNATNCYINTTNDTPHVDVYNYDYKSGFWQWLFPNIWASTQEYCFYLPESAEIIDDFVIDFE